MGKGWTKKNILLLAAIIGLITGVIVYANMKERPKVQTTVAAVAIARGELITGEMVTTKALDITAKEAVAVESVVDQTDPARPQRAFRKGPGWHARG